MDALRSSIGELDRAEKLGLQPVGGVVVKSLVGLAEPM
jgi:hypothetical protein